MLSVADTVTSFIDGRVRLRHPALRNAATADMVASMVSGVDGVESVQVNPRTGSLLIFYDAEKLSREKLLELAEQGAALLPEEEKSVADKTCSPGRLLLSRRAVRLGNRAMLVSLLCSLLGAASGMGAVHRVTGAAFALISLQHLAAHRKALW